MLITVTDYNNEINRVQVALDKTTSPKQRHDYSKYLARLKKELRSISRFEELKAENEALNSKLSQSQPLPCKVGDIVYTVTFCFGDGFAANGEHISKSGYFMQKIEVTERNLYRICELFRTRKAYFTPEAAKLRLKELPNLDLFQGLQEDIE